MCGITGFWSRRPARDADIACLERMCSRLSHRGPDAAGMWLDAGDGPALGHRRLAVVDLSENGSQPMLSATGRFVITYNGEVYNLGPLRAELRAAGQVKFRGHSDTELILAAVETWGLERTLEKLTGMFAFALWDGQKKRLHLVVDRLGKKPLYYGWANGIFLFGSELKALTPHPSFDDQLDADALTEFFRFGFIPAPLSIYRKVSKLEPGHVLTLRSPDERDATLDEYWSVESVARAGRLNPYSGSDADALADLERLLLDAVGMRMVADVPLGSLLSGGIDSSLVTALMQAQSSRPVRTFSIGYADARYDEANDARRVAAHLGTEHTELRVGWGDALDVIPSLPTYYDEPFADASQIPTFLVSRLARQHVTVALTGDGGDEVWGGYDRYVWGRRLYDTFFKAPAVVRRVCAHALTAQSPDAYNRWFDRIERLVPSQYRVRLVGDKIHKLARLAGADSAEGYHLALASLAWSTPERLLSKKPLAEPGRRRVRWPQAVPGADIAELMMLRDLAVVFPGDMLAKVDRASMAVSLECRLPLADHRVVELASRLPLRLKLQGGQGKVLLRRVLDKYVPRQLVDRPKMGFGVPIADWLRGPLVEWSSDLLSDASLSDGDLLDARPIRQAWNEHQHGKRSRHVELWAVLMFQAWRRQMPWSMPNAQREELRPGESAGLGRGNALEPAVT